MRFVRSEKPKPPPIQVLGRLWVLGRCPVRPFAGLLAVMPVVPSAFALSVGGGPRQIVPVVEPGT